MTMPRWARNWICPSLAAAALAALAGRPAIAVQSESTSGDAPVIVDAPAATQLPPSAALQIGDPWTDGWIDETCDDCIPMVWSHWTINLDAIFWRRNEPSDLQLAVSNPGVNPNASSLTFDHEAGPRLALIRRGISGWDVELNYFGIEGFRSELNMPEAVDPRIPGDDPGGLFYSDALLTVPVGMRVRYDSRLHSEEINLRRQLNDTWTGLIGIRAVQVFEDLDVGSQFDTIYAIESQNRLYGLQIGGEGKLFCTERFLFSTVLKAGLFDNNAEQATTDPDGSFPTTVDAPLSLRASTNQASFVGELGLMGTYRLTETILLRGGYNFMWISDVALASEQVTVNEFTVMASPDTTLRGITSEGSLFYHGATVGVELTW